MEVRKNLKSRVMEALSNENGQGYPLAVALALSFMLFFAVISQYFHYIIVAQGVRDALQDAVISTVTENYADVYHGVREGYSGGYEPDSEEFNEAINYGTIYEKLSQVLGLSPTSDGFEKIGAENSQEFAIHSLNVEITNAPFATADNQQRFLVESLMILEMPITFCGQPLPNLKINVKTNGGYTPVF